MNTKVNLNGIEYKLYDGVEDSKKTNIYIAYGEDDKTKLAIKKKDNVNFYLFDIPDNISYRTAFELVTKLMRLRGLLKSDIDEISMMIASAVVEK